MVSLIFILIVFYYCPAGMQRSGSAYALHSTWEDLHKVRGSRPRISIFAGFLSLFFFAPFYVFNILKVHSHNAVLMRNMPHLNFESTRLLNPKSIYHQLSQNPLSMNPEPGLNHKSMETCNRHQQCTLSLQSVRVIQIINQKQVISSLKIRSPHP